MDGISDTASIIAVAKLAASIIKYMKAVVDAPVQKRRLLIAIIQTRGLLLTLHELTNEVEDEDWSSTIQSLSSHDGPLSTFWQLLEDLARKLGITRSGSQISIALHRLRWPFDQAGLQEMIASLEKLKSNFLLALANDHIRLSMEIRNEVRNVQTQLTEATINSRRQMIRSLSREQVLIVKSLSLTSLSHELDGEKVMELRASTEWFLSHDDFKQWHTVNPIQQTLVLTGSPGSGKSSFWHQLENVCIASFFFDLSGQEELSESFVLSSIVQKILSERPYLIEHLTALRVTGGPLSVANSIKLISLARCDLDQLYIILDEFDAYARTGLRVLKTLLSIKPPINILIATRETRFLSEALQDYLVVRCEDARPSRVYLDSIKAMLEQEPRILAHLDHDPEKIAEIAIHLVERSKGLYIWITQMVKLLARARNRTQFQSALKNDFPILIETYNLMLRDLTEQPPELVKLATKTLKIILDAGEPVDATQLMSDLAPEIAASMPQRDTNLTTGGIIEAIESSCKGFISSSGQLSTYGIHLRFIHQTTKEFLEDKYANESLAA
ncbi:uncharacterized protein N7498_007191 [Penicillium cinerascens]|uniref:Nephrocystin 3-like N-terminal domain-containing protein n=1 Tax=Penicillium cinerascens TaxID=70096 RepID=A0A9W9JJG2_9EURO|nr:uncharacterized protein N7498_007191 [Penicillium cinerascens]KAJ5198074.1 hypothetical protein N7498_007191 [Penicillium cinerascens]